MVGIDKVENLSEKREKIRVILEENLAKNCKLEK